MNDTIYTNINKIIERDSKSSTYKFALLRGVIDMIGDNSPYIEVREDEESRRLQDRCGEVANIRQVLCAAYFAELGEINVKVIISPFMGSEPV